MAVKEKSDPPSYWQYYLSSDISQVSIVLVLFQVPNLLFAYSDYIIHGFTAVFYLLISLRVLLLTVSMLILLLLRKYRSVICYRRLVLAFAMLAGVVILLIESTRPAGYILYTLVDMALLVCYYLLLPNRYILRIIPPIVFTIGGLVLFFYYKKPVSHLDINAILTVYLVFNLLFYLVSQQLYHLRWKHYCAMVQQYDLARRLSQMASTDELTGIYNRREILNLGERELDRFKRYGRVFTLVMLDIDYFKQINDTYGHLIGDQVLVGFADYIKRNIRIQDMFGRIGGEEFLLILPETRIEDAVKSINRLEVGTGTLKIPIKEQTLELTVSMGITECLPHDETIEDLIYRADEGLYKAKAEGRNRVVVVYGDLI